MTIYWESFLITTLLTSVVNGIYFKLEKKQIDAKRVIKMINGATKTFCVLQCQQDKGCDTIGFAEIKTIGELPSCYLLRKEYRDVKNIVKFMILDVLKTDFDLNTSSDWPSVVTTTTTTESVVTTTTTTEPVVTATTTTESVVTATTTTESVVTATTTTESVVTATTTTEPVVTATTTTESPTTSSACVLDYDFGYPLNDIKVTRANTWKTCAKECTALNNCEFFTWYSSKNICNLKSKKESRKKKLGRISGSKECGY